MCIRDSFTKCMGVEILGNLHAMCMELSAIWADDIWYELDGKKKETEIGFLHGDIRYTDWMDGTVIFCNWTTFDKGLMDELLILLEELPQDSIVITTTRELKHEEFTLLGQSSLVHTWGKSSVFISKKYSTTALADVSVDDLLASMSLDVK